MKFKVTPELATLIKTIRMQNNISSKELAEIIEKSPSYVSKLENGDVKSIKKELLTEILSYITEGEDFYNDKLPNIFRILSTLLTSENILSQTWLIQYDTFERSINIPAEMSKDLASRLEKLNLSISEFAAIINANHDSGVSARFPSNEISVVDYPEGPLFRLRIQIEEQQLNDILNNHNATMNYGIIYTVIFTLIKLEKHGNIGHMKPLEAKDVLRETENYLTLHNVFTLSKYAQILSSNEFQFNQLQITQNSDSKKTEIVQEIYDMFKMISDYDNVMATQTWENFKNNLAWDPAFTLKIIGLPYTSLEGLSYSKKRTLLNEITELIEHYSQLPEFEKKIENY